MLSPKAKEIFNHLQIKPSTRLELTKVINQSEGTVRLYLKELMEAGIIKGLQGQGRTKIYAAIDYIPVVTDEPLIMRWQVYSSKANTTYSVGQLATRYRLEFPSAADSALLLYKLPAFLVYYAEKANDFPADEMNEALAKLKEELQDGIEWLKNSISILVQYLGDPRYWDIERLAAFKGSPDYPGNQEVKALIERLLGE